MAAAMRRAWEMRVSLTIHRRDGVCVCVAIVVEMGSGLIVDCSEGDVKEHKVR